MEERGGESGSHCVRTGLGVVGEGWRAGRKRVVIIWVTDVAAMDY